MFCSKCGTQLDSDVKFCAKCGTATQQEPVAARPAVTPLVVAPVYQPISPPTSVPAMKPTASLKPIPLIAIVICAILWFAAPFMAVNMFTMGDQPTALQLVTGDVMLLGEITETPAFWAAVVSAIGIVLCLLFTIAKKNIASRVLSILTNVVLVLAAVMVADMDLTEMIGLGYLGIFILLWVVCFAANNKKVVAKQPQPILQPVPMGQPPFIVASPPVQAPPQPTQVPPPQSVPMANNACAACGKALGEEEWKCPACGAFRE